MKVTKQPISVEESHAHLQIWYYDIHIWLNGVIKQHNKLLEGQYTELHDVSVSSEALSKKNARYLLCFCIVSVKKLNNR